VKSGGETSVPEVHLRADKETRYERIAFVLAAAQQAGLTKIGFITEPVSGAAVAKP
jgi:biopolymer transport protein ExbD